MIDHNNCVQAYYSPANYGNDAIGDDSAYAKFQKQLGIKFLPPEPVRPPELATYTPTPRQQFEAIVKTACGSSSFLFSLCDGYSRLEHSTPEQLRESLIAGTRDLIQLAREETDAEPGNPLIRRLANSLRAAHARWLGASPNLDFRPPLAAPIATAAGYTSSLRVSSNIYCMAIEARTSPVTSRAIEIFGMAIELLALKNEPFEALSATLNQELMSLYPTTYQQELLALASNLIS